MRRVTIDTRASERSKPYKNKRKQKVTPSRLRREAARAEDRRAELTERIEEKALERRQAWSEGRSNDAERLTTDLNGVERAVLVPVAAGPKRGQMVARSGRVGGLYQDRGGQP